jgi:serine/threonine-protein kinase
MNHGRWLDVERVLDLTLDSDPATWSTILDTHCSSDPELRREVEALLGRYERGKRFLGSPPAAAAALLIQEARDTAYTREVKRVGVYRLIREIGHGGMSLVFLAERDDGQFTQQVALKLLRPGHDSEIDQGRFRAERQILASLNHPNIARLLDGGVTDDGLPYLVMELVDGEPIDRYCERKSLSLRQRLDAFVTVAEATQFAHRNLIVHRDLKPSNILVTRDGQVKLLDFGLAKLLEPSGEERVTVTTQRWMTPEYAAPEQIVRHATTTLTDVYQLGAVLYEMLTGRLPFGSRERSAFELERAILEQEPSLPSALASRSALRGDLDAIVLKALRKEPEQRYASAQDFADDVRRHLSGLPVLARKQTTVYRARRFVRRHAWALAAAAILVFAASAYAITVTVQRARVEAALLRATAEAAKAQESTQFLMALFSSGSSEISPRDTLTSQLLARGERRANELRDQPLAHAQLLSVLGTIHHRMRSFARAESLHRRALTLRRASLGDDNTDVAESMFQLGLVLAARGESDTARSLLRQSLDIRRRFLGEAHPDVAQTRLRLANWTPLTAAEKIQLLRQMLAVSRRAYGPEHPEVAERMLELGSQLRNFGFHAEAEPFLRESLAMRRRVAGEDKENIYRHMLALGLLLTNQGKLAAAETLHREILDWQVARFGSDNMGVSGALRMLSDVLAKAGRYDEAERLARRDLAIREREFGPQHLDYAYGLYPLADILLAKGELAGAESLRRRELAIMERTYGVDAEPTAGAIHGLARVLIERRAFAEAESLMLRVIALRERRFGKKSYEAAQGFPTLARLAREQRQFRRADSLLVSALGSFRARGLSDVNEWIQRCYHEQVALYQAWGQPEQAAAVRAKLVGDRR